MKKIINFSIFLSIALMLIIVFYPNKNDDSFTIKVIEVENGFGYTILYKNKMLIKQETIPVIETKNAFCNKKDALAIANIVKYRLENGLSPAITALDLKNNNIKTNCSN